MNPPRRQRTLRLALIAAIALLIAQLGAVLHLYAHGVGDAAAAARQQLPGAHELCGDCLNFAPLLAGADCAAGIAFDAGPARPCRHVDALRDTGRGTPLLAFRSRAPPAVH